MHPEHPQHSPHEHRSPQESNEQVHDDPLLVQRSEEIRKELAVTNEMEWSNALQCVVAVPPLPTDADTRNPEQKALLFTQYQLVADGRMEIAKALTAVLAFVDAPDRSLSELNRRAIFRLYARYLVEYNAYVKLAGAEEKAIIIPEFLGKDINILEENEFSIRVAEMLLPLQYDVATDLDVSASPRDVARVSEQIVLLIVRYNLRFSHVEQCLDDQGRAVESDAPYEKLLRTLGLEQVASSDMQACKLLVGFLVKHRETIQQYAKMEGRNQSDLTIAEALQCTADMPNIGLLTKDFALQAKAFFNWETTDISANLDKTFSDERAYPDAMVRMKMELLRPVALAVAPSMSQEEFETHVTGVTNFFLTDQYNGPRIAVRNIGLHHGALNDVQKAMVEEVCRIGTGEESLQLLTQALLIPTKDRDQSDEDTVEALRTLLSQKQISARDAFDLYYLTRSGAGKTSPNIALTFKALQLVRKHDEFLAIDLQTALFEKLSRLASMNAEDLTAHLSEFGFSDDQQREMANVAQYLRDEGIDKMHESIYQFLALHERFPWMWLITGSAVVGPATAVTIAGRRVYIKYNYHSLNAFANASPDELITKYRLPTYVTPDQIREAQRDMTKILQARDRLGERFHLFGAARNRNLANSLRLSFSTRDVDTIARSLRGRFVVGQWVGGVSAKEAADILKHASPSPIHIRTAMEAAGYPVEEVRRVLRNVEWPTASRQWAEQAMIKNIERMQDRVPKFMQQLTELEEYFPNIRQTIASEIWGAPLTNDQWKIIDAAHKNPTTTGKYRELLKLGDTTDEAFRSRIQKFMRLGITGGADSALLDVVESNPAILGHIDDADSPSSAVRQRALDALDADQGLKNAATYSQEAQALKKGASSSMVAKGVIGLSAFVDGFFIVQNEIALRDPNLDPSTRSILQSKRATLIASGAGNALSGVMAVQTGSKILTRLAGPAGLAILGGTLVADHLYAKAEYLNSVSKPEFLDRSRSTLLSEAQNIRDRNVLTRLLESITLPANIDDPYAFVTKLLYEGYLAKGVRPSIVELQRRGLDGSMSLGELSEQESYESRRISFRFLERATDDFALEPTSLDLRQAEQCGRLLRLGMSGITRFPYIDSSGNTVEVDTSVFADSVEVYRLLGSPEGVEQVRSAIRNYEQYEVATMRNQSLLAAEMGDIEGANAMYRTFVLERLRDPIVRMEASIASANIDLTGYFDEEPFRNAVRLAMRQSVQSALTSFTAAAWNPENSDTVIHRSLDEYAQTLADKDWREVFASIDPATNQFAKNFYGLRSSLGAPVDFQSQQKLEMYAEAQAAYVRKISSELGIQDSTQILTSIVGE